MVFTQISKNPVAFVTPPLHYERGRRLKNLPDLEIDMSGQALRIANQDTTVRDSSLSKRRFGCFHVLLFIGVTVVVTTTVILLVFRAILFPPPFKPVKLNDREEKALQIKLNRLNLRTPPSTTGAEAALEPEPYSEEGADRSIRFTEKELNALLAKNTDLADKLVIDLSRDLVSAKLRIPLDEDVPVMGGQVLRARTGVTFSYAEGRPIVRLIGVTVMGVPLPNAWLGGMKNIDLIQESAGNAGFWKAFADGVDAVRVEEGHITITLKE